MFFTANYRKIRILATAFIPWNLVFVKILRNVDDTCKTVFSEIPYRNTTAAVVVNFRSISFESIIKSNLPIEKRVREMSTHVSYK